MEHKFIVDMSHVTGEIQLDHICICDGSYIDVYKFFWPNLVTKDEQGVKNQFKGINLFHSPEPSKRL